MTKKQPTLDAQFSLDFDTVPEPSTSRLAPVVAGPANEVATLVLGVASVHPCLLNARTDAEAIEAWIAARCADPGAAAAGRPDHTARSYRREAQRFVMWLHVERRVTRLDGASVEACVAYKHFLADPQPVARWCGPRGEAIGTAEWRPFAGALSARSIRQAMTILGGMYRFLHEMRYVSANPWCAVSMPRSSEPRIDTGRSLSRQQWLEVERELDAGPRDVASVQLAWAVRLLYHTGLRLAEVCTARCLDLRHVANDEPTHATSIGRVAPGPWVLRVIGKGFKTRDVVVPDVLVERLAAMVLEAGDGSRRWCDLDQPLLVIRGNRKGGRGQQPQAQSPQALYRQLKRLFARVSARLAAAGRLQDADTLSAASTHWLRHTHCTHSVAAGVPIDVVRESAGHASLATTSIYIRPGLDRRAREGARLADWLTR